mgnify:CR=1 FL=1
MKGLVDKVAIITGAGQGIGRATALRFAQEGSQVVVAEFNSETGQSVVDEIIKEGKTGQFIQVDVAERDTVQAMVSETLSAFGRIDILVNNAGIIKDNTLKKMTDEEFDKILNINLRGTYICTQEIAEVMRGQQAGVILNASSVVALYGNFGQTNYVASKAGIIGMTKVWARELGKDGIRVNAVAPGFIETSMVESIPEDVMAMMLKRVPLGKVGQPEDIAAAYAFLASNEASFITGTVLSVDGGAVT